MKVEYMDLVIGHCPKCLGSDIQEVSNFVVSEQIQCLDCGLVFQREEMILGVDPI